MKFGEFILTNGEGGLVSQFNAAHDSKSGKFASKTGGGSAPASAGSGSSSPESGGSRSYSADDRAAFGSNTQKIGMSNSKLNRDGSFEMTKDFVSAKSAETAAAKKLGTLKGLGYDDARHEVVKLPGKDNMFGDYQLRITGSVPKTIKPSPTGSGPYRTTGKADQEAWNPMGKPKGRDGSPN